jgi:ABC-type transport system involved in cytochrome c biogenesis permease subunit
MDQTMRAKASSAAAAITAFAIAPCSAVEALQALKERLSRTLMNAWAPQLFGQQFYASNFMYVTFPRRRTL